MPTVIIHCSVYSQHFTSSSRLYYFVRSNLEYSSPVWNPITVISINKLEHVQYHFANRIPSSRHLTYPERLAILDLEPFEVRRLGFDLHMQYKFFNGLAADRFKYSNPTSLFTRSGGPNLVKPIPYVIRINR